MGQSYYEVKKRTAEPQNIECRMSKDGIASLSLFKNRQNTLFDVGRSMFDVRCSFVSQLIRLDAGGQAVLTPDT